MSSRYINTAFWSDPWIRSMTSQERYLFLYLLTNEKTNIAGVYEIALDRMMFDTKLGAKAISAAFATFEAAGKAYYREGWVVLRNAPKHQSLSSDKTVKGISRILEGIPAEIEALLFEIQYQMSPYKEGPSKTDEGAYKGHKPGNKDLRYYTLLNSTRLNGSEPPNPIDPIKRPNLAPILASLQQTVFDQAQQEDQ